MPITLIIRNPLDRDAREYIQRAGVTDAAARSQINGFVRGIKGLGLWSSMVCWPLRSSQNAGTGTTAYSLGGLGTYNGTLVNGPTWGTDGITFVAASSQRITTSLIAQIGASGGVYNINIGTDQSVWSNRNASTWANGTTLNARASGSDSIAFVDVAGANSRIRATGTPVFSEYVFTQATHTLAGSTTTANTTFRQNKNSRSSGTYVLGSAAMATSDAEIILAAERTSTITNFLNGTMPFVFVSEAIFSSSEQESLYDLYKSTLGQGLGLP